MLLSDRVGYSTTTKEIRQEITQHLYNELHSIEQIDVMRREVRKRFVTRDNYDKWHGCRLAIENGNYYIYHRVSRDFQGDYLNGR